MNRTKRVKTLKKLIVGTVIALIILPTILCVILFVYSRRLQQQIYILTDRVAVAEEGRDDPAEQYETMQDTYRQEIDELTSKISDLENELTSLRDLEKNEPASETKTSWPKKVYLTFDDGPSGHTQDILDILDSYGVKGNFFVCATQNEDYQKFYRKILDEGHMLGLHSYTHVYEDIYASEEAFREDVLAIRSFVNEQTGGYNATYYRFPGGSTNLHARISIQSCAEWLTEQGLVYYDWNLSSQDAVNPMQSKESIVRNATFGCENFEEVVVLMHDLGNKDTTVEALPEIIEYYQNLGAVISVIDENSMRVQHDQ